MVDQSIFIPMRGMVQSLNVSVAASILLFEAIRQRKNKGILPANGEGLNIDEYQKTLFEWCYPELAEIYKKLAKEYPKLNDQGEFDPIKEN